MARILKGNEFLRWLDADPESQDTCLAEFTPELCGILQPRNTKNRPVQSTKVAGYGLDMGESAFPLTSSGIGVDVQGRITNGQHRLLACLQSGVAFVSVVVKGLPLDSFQHEDTQSKRTIYDVLAIRGESHARCLAGALSWLHRYRHQEAAAAGEGRGAGPDRRRAPRSITNAGGSMGMSHARLLARLDAEPGLRHSAARHARHERVLLFPSVLACLHHLGTAVDRDRTEAFLVKVVEGAGLTTDEPAYALIQALQSGLTGRTRMRPETKFQYACKALKYAINDFPLMDLKLQVGERFPFLAIDPELQKPSRRNRRTRERAKREGAGETS